MEKIKVMVNGIPGNMASNVAQHVLRDDRFSLIPFSLTGPEILVDESAIYGQKIELIRPDQRDQAIVKIKETEGSFISVDFTHPSAVNSNAEFYCQYDLPFVMGTTGGDRKRLEETVIASSIIAVIATNMAKQIVGFQAMTEYAANNFPNLFAGYSPDIRESHQKEKVDTSGTAKDMVKYFAKLGVSFSVEDIDKERRPKIQKTRWGIPEQFLSGHGWHTYTLVSPDGTVKFEFTHNVNGRDVYALGTLDAITFLHNKVCWHAGAWPMVYTMIQVLKG